jgi:hypothetical protein
MLVTVAKAVKSKRGGVFKPRWFVKLQHGRRSLVGAFCSSLTEEVGLIPLKNATELELLQYVEHTVNGRLVVVILSFSVKAAGKGKVPVLTQHSLVKPPESSSSSDECD